MIKSSSRGISLQKFKHVLNLFRNYTFGLCVACAFSQPNSEREQGLKTRKERKRRKKRTTKDARLSDLSLTPVSIDVKPIRIYWTRGASFFRFICGAKCTVQISRHWDKDPQPPWRLTPAPHHPLNSFRIRNKTLQNDSRLLTGEWKLLWHGD